jgi:hypothetical protein
MASTYVNDLRLNEMATGDGSGTWGTTTNTNLELIGEALGYGTEGITTNADTHTSTVADGATDPVRAMFVKYTGTLDSACTITIAPNTVNRMQFIENGTSGSQNIIISQGSGANITIPPGDVKAVYLDGAGSGAAVVDAFASLSVVDLKVQDDLTVTDDLIVNGDIDLAGSIDVDGTANLDIVDIDGAVDMATTLAVAGNVDFNGDLDVDGTANLDIVDIDGAVDMASTLTVAGVLTGASLDISGDIDIDGTANLDIVDVDGAVNFAADVTYADGADIITASAGTSNVRFGVNAGNSIASGGNYNTVVGDEAGTAINTGDDNTFIGYAAGDATTTANSNTAVGSNSLTANTTGALNIAMGVSALAANISGDHNIALGSVALAALTTADDNTAVGSYALNVNTASYNTAVGRAALTANTTGASNTAVGYGAMLDATTGTENSSFGGNAGADITTGDHNTCIGHNAGFHTTPLTTGEQNVLIGSYTGCATADTDEANGFGHGINAAGGYTTIGNDAADIRAAHGVITWAVVSDERVKKDIVDSTVGLNFINDLRPVTFDYKNKGDLPKEFRGYEEGSTEVYKNKKTQHGFIAQEVKAAIDKHSDIKDGFSMWDDNDEVGQQRVGETALIPVLVKAIQELSAEVEKLKGA